jgi:hypothetical protein
VKATILLATALFLAAAPEPESAVISEMTAHFIVLDHPKQLQAAEAPLATAMGTAHVTEHKDCRNSQPAKHPFPAVPALTNGEQSAR